MAEDLTSMDDSALDAMIYDNPSEHATDIGGESDSIADSDVNPIASDDEQIEPTEEVIDVDQTSDEGDVSDDEATDEEQTDDSEEDTEADDDEPDATDTEPDEDKAQDSDTKDSKPTEKFQPLRVDGKEIPIDSIQELYTLASKAAGAQAKFNAIAPVRKAMMLGQKENVDLMDSVNFQINMKNDPKGTILNLLKEHSLDPMELDIDDAGKFKPKDYSPTDFEVGFDDVVGRIGNDPKYADTMDVVNNVWNDAGSRDTIYKDPTIIEKLHEEMKVHPDLNGKSMYEIVSPLAQKMKLMGDGNKSNFEYYMEARTAKVKEMEDFTAKTANSEVPKKMAEKKAKVVSKKKKASPTGGTGANKATLDFGSMSDAELDAFLAKTN